jgi:hypothetical protein
MEFGDGSNQWLPGIGETLANPVDRVSNPYDTVAGAADAAALKFDEGVGGLYSLVDDEPGNTAGPGQEPMFTFGASSGPGGPLGAGIPLPYLVVGVLATVLLLPPLLRGAAEGVVQ